MFATVITSLVPPVLFAATAVVVGALSDDVLDSELSDLVALTWEGDSAPEARLGVVPAFVTVAAGVAVDVFRWAW